MSHDQNYAIKLFFNEIIKLSHRPEMMKEAVAAGGYPLSGLINELFISDDNRLINKITNDCTGESHEFRLNEAGLKLYWRTNQERDLLKVSIGGDQADNYPHFVAAVRLIIKWNNYLI